MSTPPPYRPPQYPRQSTEIAQEKHAIQDAEKEPRFDEIRKSLVREQGMRVFVYPGRVFNGKMTAKKAAHEILCIDRTIDALDMAIDIMKAAATGQPGNYTPQEWLAAFAPLPSDPPPAAQPELF